jgi:hypothetical protein
MGCTQELAPESRFSEPHVRLQPNINMKFSKSYRSVEFESDVARIDPAADRWLHTANRAREKITVRLRFHLILIQPIV